MNLAFSDEQRLIQKTVRRFIQEELLPVEMKVPAGWWLPPAYHQPLVRKAQALGLWAIEVPVRFGGGGLDCVTSTLIHEEMGQCTVGNAVLGAPAPMYLYEGTPYQVDRYLLPVVRGEQRDFFALTEPHTGADPASMRTRAVRDGESYIINGAKTFISFVDECQWGLVFAATGANGGRAGVSAFLVENHWPGFQIVRQIPTVHSWLTSFELAFDDLRVPAENLVGGEGQGFAQGQNWLNRNRLLFGSEIVGMGERLIRMSAGYAKLRVTFGQPLASRQAIQWMLADAWIETYALRSMTYHAAWRYDQGEDVRQETAAIKAYLGDVGFRVADRAMQIHGAAGTARDLPIERYWRDVRHHRIGEGSQEMMKFVIARSLLRD